MASDSSTIHRINPDDGTLVPRAATLDGFAAEATGPGVAVHGLAPLTALYVQTRNTRYHIIVRKGDEIVIQGGSFFPDPTPAHLDGASLGSSLLKLGWIGVGLRMEIRAAGQRIVTTPVRSITSHDSVPVPRPH
jgi:hypothetical protein